MWVVFKEKINCRAVCVSYVYKASLLQARYPSRPQNYWDIVTTCKNAYNKLLPTNGKPPPPPHAIG